MAVTGVRRGGASLAIGGTALLLTGCAGLPASGPTAHQILMQAAPRGGAAVFNVVSLDQASVHALNAAAPASLSPGGLAPLADAVSRGVIGPGDTLKINLYEVGVSLFSGSKATAAGADAFDASAHGQEFAAVTVDRNGNIRLPFAGTLQVGGLTTDRVEQEIERRLSDKSQHPQVVVTIAESIFSSVVVTGDVRKPGRITLTSGQEHLVDAIAVAGGTEEAIDDVVVRFVRKGQRVEKRLGDIVPGSADDLILDPGDRIEVVRQPRSFTVFGAAGKVSEVPFESSRVSLAEAIARVGGPSDSAADPTAIFLFRNDAPRGTNGLPNIYRISMLDPRTYFLAQNVKLRDKDLIYIANSRSSRPSKFVAIINQLFSPAVAARAIAQ